MKQIALGGGSLKVSAIAVGCMRHAKLEAKEMAHFIRTASDLGIDYYDHADIYGGGKSESVFGEALALDKGIKREELYIQSKCGIHPGIMYDMSSRHILEAVDGTLKRLGIEYLDALLLHRPDALTEPEEVAEAFDILHASGKVRAFGVSNHKPMQIELLKKCVKQPLIIDQLQFALPVSNMVANGMEVNMENYGSVDRDGSVLDYCRLNDITIQAWSPFQKPCWKGPFIGDEEYAPLNAELNVLAEKYGVTPTGIATAWVLRHPAHMQLISGTTNEARLREICAGADITLTREEWYKLYLAAGHPLP